ncbi:hypothetical protein CFP65_3269 [Kitasatospora sp. MMS16-BH015]|uniref:hypothetical protein n=1 Tax=Kitasatospora sp. MMS16-BH015 TaxID=2018025 RepID=UPI000CA2E324|nr:hypothetical protein [Kitasatospora sp. MMS16-BH015]AUG78070.1 hypothetical protein CFP65_3269 [Kitasatospora sp. MMS16-BH015]
MWESTPFAEMVREATTGEEVTYRKLAETAIDPKTGQQLTHNALWKIAHAEQVKISPWIVRAVAAALGKDVREVQAAAAEQYIGLTAGDPFDATTPGAAVVVAHVPGLRPADMPKVEELLRNWAAGSGGSSS